MTAMSTIPLLLLFALSLGQADEIHGPFALSFEDPFHGTQWQVWLRPNFGDVINILIDFVHQQIEIWWLH